MGGIPVTRVLPVLMVVAAICFGIRFSQVMASVYERSQGSYEERDITRELNDLETAAGQEGDTAAPPPDDQLKGQDEAKPAEAVVKEDKKITEATPPEGSLEKPKIEPPKLNEVTKKEEWKAADDLDDEYSDVKMELFTDLSKRRKDVEAKEKELAMREALLKAAQAELEQKTNELNGIKADIENLLKKQTEQEDKRIASLVKIYEGMKAKDAARIFDSLEMDVLLQVMTKMSERKSAPILAAMDPDKARNVTILLAEQNKLPEIPALPAVPETSSPTQ